MIQKENGIKKFEVFPFKSHNPDNYSFVHPQVMKVNMRMNQMSVRSINEDGEDSSTILLRQSLFLFNKRQRKIILNFGLRDRLDSESTLKKLHVKAQDLIETNRWRSPHQTNIDGESIESLD